MDRVRLAAPVQPARAAGAFTVTCTGDVADAESEGACDFNPTRLEVECTLREAIHGANFSPGDQAGAPDPPPACRPAGRRASVGLPNRVACVPAGGAAVASASPGVVAATRLGGRRGGGGGGGGGGAG
jgi:hypothetical protein